MEDLLYVEDEYEYYTESEVEADGEEEEDDDDETIKNVPIRSVSRWTLFSEHLCSLSFPENIPSDASFMLRIPGSLLIKD